MHIEFLVEDVSGKKILELLVPKIINNDNHTSKFHAYKGIGHIPRNAKSAGEIKTQKLLNELPKMLRAYGKTFAGYQEGYAAAVVVVCDLDKRNKNTFLQELHSILAQCTPQPETRFCLAVEEGEAWFLGDMEAIKKAYPNANPAVLARYKNDSICGTWELLADAVYKGGSPVLRNKNYSEIGAVKTEWAERISPHMDIENNKSPSFVFFRDSLSTLVGAESQ